MSDLSKRAEHIAAHLVGHETGAQIDEYDRDGRQGVVDFMLVFPDGDSGALEVTMITEPESSAWQGMATRDGWRWPAETSWDFRPASTNFPYKRTKRAALRAVSLCDEWQVNEPSSLPRSVLASEPDVAKFLSENVGHLKRSQFSPGIAVYPAVKTEFVDAAPANFALVVESWLNRSHIQPHLDKLHRALDVSTRILFLVVVSESLPVRFFTDDFEAPCSELRGYEGIDAVFIWSDYWHRFLSFQGGRWAWIAFPLR